MSNHSQNKTSNKLIGWTAICISPLAGFSIDIFTPSLPSIAQHFATTTSMVQLGISLYLLGYGALQFIFGTLADSFGRKPLLLLGLIGTILSTFLIIFSPSIYYFLAFRFIQGVSLSAPIVVTRALLTDTYEGRELEKMSHIMPIAWSIGPIIAPFIGGYLQHYFGWQSNFIFLTCYAAFLLILTIKNIPETLKQPQTFSLTAIKKTYIETATHPIFIASIITMAISYGFITIFNGAGPFLIETSLGYSPIQFGHIALTFGIAWFLGSFLFKHLRNHYSARIIIIATHIVVFSSVTLLLLFSFFYFTLWAMVIPMFVLFAASAILFSNAMANNMALFKKGAATASAFMGTTVMLGSGLLAMLGSTLSTKNLIPIATSYFILALVVTLVFLLIRSK